MIDPLTLLGAFLVYREVTREGGPLSSSSGSSSAGAADAPPALDIGKPIHFRPDQLARFTHSLEGGTVAFDPDLGPKLEHRMSARSAQPIDDKGRLGPGIVAYRLGPPDRRFPVAAELVKRARVEGRAVLGSLSMVLLSSGKDVPILLVIAPAGSEARLAPPGGNFAVLRPPTPPAPAVDKSAPNGATATQGAAAPGRG